MFKVFEIVANFLGFISPKPVPTWQPVWGDFLNRYVAFYRVLTPEGKRQFEQRLLMFLQTTRVEAGQFEVTNEDCLLVAASAIIPVWAFPGWHYFNLQGVFLLPKAFNKDLEFDKPDSCITGMVGRGVMQGKLVLSKPDLYRGFENSLDKSNVGIHEFVHLIDMADGDCDGFPERLKEHPFSIPWFEMVKSKVDEIIRGDSNIPDYGATNRAEFFAVASEYFFERPQMLNHKHPKLYSALADIYQQDLVAIAKDAKSCARA